MDSELHNQPSVLSDPELQDLVAPSEFPILIYITDLTQIQILIYIANLIQIYNLINKADLISD